MSRWARGWRFVLGVALLATLTRLPSLVRPQALNPDEAYLATEARVLADGGRLYVDVVDRKPPVVPYLYASAQRVTGTDSLGPERVLALAAHLATALLLAALARRRWGDTAAVVAAVLFLFASAGFSLDDAQAANFEVFMLPPTVAAVLLAERGRPVAAGLAAAGAGLVKQVGLVVMAPVVLLAWRKGSTKGALSAVASCGGLLVATAVAFGWHDFVFWNVTGSRAFVDPSGSWREIYDTAASDSRTFLLGSGVAIVLAALGVRRWRAEVDLWVWLAVSALGVAAGFHFFGHYYLQLLPPLVLLAAATAAALHTRAVQGGLVVAAVIAACFVLPAFNSPVPAPGYEELARAVAARTAPDDSIFVWGHLPQVYWAADRPPATRFLTTGFLTGYSRARAPDRVGLQYATPGAWEQLFADLDAHPPAVVVDLSARTYFPIDSFPRFATWLRANYHVAAEVLGVPIYERGAP